MIVKNWMTTDVITVSPETTLLKIARILKENNIRRVPVLNDNSAIVGMVTDRDVKDASPSKATSLDMYEMHYLLAEIKAADIMTPKPIVIKDTDTIEKAAMIMLDNKIGGLPVVDAKNKLVGIVSDQDIFKALVIITGVREGGIQLGFSIANRQGAMKPVFDLIRQYGGRIISVLSTNNDKGERTIFLRLKEMDNTENEIKIIDGIKEYANLLYWEKNEAQPANKIS